MLSIDSFKKKLQTSEYKDAELFSGRYASENALKIFTQ